MYTMETTNTDELFSAAIKVQMGLGKGVWFRWVWFRWVCGVCVKLRKHWIIFLNSFIAKSHVNCATLLHEYALRYKTMCKELEPLEVLQNVSILTKQQRFIIIIIIIIIIVCIDTREGD